MIRRDVFERVGLFSEEYFMYAEDVDLCYKVRQLALKNYFIGRATVIHHGGGSSKRSEVNQWSTILQRKAVLMFCRKTRGRLYASTFRAAMGAAALCRLAILGPILLFGKTAADRIALRPAVAKWTAILRWAIGLEAQGQSPAHPS